MSYTLHMPQYSPEWWAARIGRPTASSAGKILTGTGKRSDQAKAYLYELVAERAGHYLEPREPNEAMLEGSRREAESRDAYAFVTGREVQEVGMVICDATGASCSPDGLLGEHGGLELKNPKAGTFFFERDSAKVPTAYLPQIHFSLAVTGREWWDYCCYITGEAPLIHTIQPNEYTTSMAQAIADFCGELDATCKRLGVPLLPQLEKAA